MTEGDQMAFLRSRGCRCPLRWSDASAEPVPFSGAGCSIGACDDRRRCFWIDDLNHAKQRDLDVANDRTWRP